MNGRGKFVGHETEKKKIKYVKRNWKRMEGKRENVEVRTLEKREGKWSRKVGKKRKKRKRMKQRSGGKG